MTTSESTVKLARRYVSALKKARLLGLELEATTQRAIFGYDRYVMKRIGTWGTWREIKDDTLADLLDYEAEYVTDNFRTYVKMRK